MSNTILYELRAATKDLHDETEKLLFPNLASIDESGYRFFLQCNLLFHHSYEPEVSRRGFTNSSKWAAFDRSKLLKLYKDAAHLGINHPAPNASNPFEHWPDMKMLGAAYVSEGSSLGGQVILKALRKQTFFNEGNHGNFLSLNGQDTGSAWKSFLQLLESEGQKNKVQVIQGAREAFGHFAGIAKHLQSQSEKTYI